MSRYDGATIVDRSIALGQPVVYVSMNYRVSGWLVTISQLEMRYSMTMFHLAFGFLPGKEVKAAGVGNLGLQDRMYRFTLSYYPHLTLILFLRT